MNFVSIARRGHLKDTINKFNEAERKNEEELKK